MGNLSGPAMLLVGGRAVGLVASFAIGIILARMFEPEVFGTYKQFFLVYMTLYGLAQLGMAESLYYFVPRNARATGRYVANALLTLGAAGVVCMAALYVGRGWIATRFNNAELAGHILPLGLFLTLTLVATVLEIVMVSRKRHMTAAVTYALSDIGRTLFFIVPALAFASLRSVFIGATIFAALRLLATVAAMWREFGHEFKPDFSVWKEQLAYALPFALAVGIEVIQINYHQIVVASTFEPATFAMYTIGCLQIPLVDLIVTSTVNVLMVQMGEESSRGRVALKLWHDTIARLAFLIVPLAVFLTISARELIIGLFTETYAASVPIFVVWALSILPTIMAVDAVLRVYAQTRFLLVMNVVRLAMVAVFIGPFISAFGLVGAVLVTLVATTVVRIAAVVRIARLMQVPALESMPWRRLATTTAMALAAAVPVLWMRYLITLPEIPRVPAELVSLFVGAALYGAAYFAMAYGGDVLRTIRTDRTDRTARTIRTIRTTEV